MGNVSADQKIQLAQMIRAENQDNRLKMRSREKMLYGTNAKFESEELPLYTRGYYDGYKNNSSKELYALENGAETIMPTVFSSFKLRFVLAIFLFAAFLILDAGNGNIAGISTAQLKEEINRDFDSGLDSIVFDFEHNFPYTLFEGSKDS